MSEWYRYTEVDLTDDELKEIEDGDLANLERDGQAIHLICQNDEAPDVYGVLDDDGDLLVTGAGFCYQTWHHADWLDLIDSVVYKYRGRILPDTYVQSVCVKLPWDDEDAETLIRLIDAVTLQATEEFADREAEQAAK